eukprot:5971632-Prymnesium_polylepis.1
MITSRSVTHEHVTSILSKLERVYFHISPSNFGGHVSRRRTAVTGSVTTLTGAVAPALVRRHHSYADST